MSDVAYPLHEECGDVYKRQVVRTVVTAIYDLIKNNYWVFAALKGVQCAVVPIIGLSLIHILRPGRR